MTDEAAALNATDPSQPNTARAYDYALGGKDNYTSDRGVADGIIRMSPDAARAAKDNRAFLSRAVKYVADKGVSQFIDIGAGFPLPGLNTHDWALEANRGARVAYVDINPAVVGHLQAKAVFVPQIVAIQGDLSEPRAIMTNPVLTRCVDLEQPVAVVLGAVLHFVPTPLALAVVGYIGRGLAPGSFLVISHATVDGSNPEHARRVRDRYAADMGSPLELRNQAEIAEFFEGFEMAQPGVVNVTEWRNPEDDKSQLILYGGVARKPSPRLPRG